MLPAFYKACQGLVMPKFFHEKQNRVTAYQDYVIENKEQKLQPEAKNNIFVSFLIDHH